MNAALPVRVGVVFCIGLTLVTAVWRLFDDALPGQDHWATVNSSQTYVQRTFPTDEFIGSAHVAEDARLWMPRDATYRVVVGEKYKFTPWSWAAPNFLAGFLFPRRRDESGATPWIVCLGCEQKPAAVLSDGQNGVSFGRGGG
jgi:hypothetical protein